MTMKMTIRFASHHACSFRKLIDVTYRPRSVAYTGIWKGGDTWGSGGLPPAGSRGSAPVGDQGGEAPLKLKGFL